VQTCQAAAQIGEIKATVQLLSLHWLFNGDSSARSSLTSQNTQSKFASPKNPTKGFTIRLAIDLKTFDGEKQLLEISNVLDVKLRQHDRNDRNRQNYPAFKMPDGSVPVLEATLQLRSSEHPDWQEMTIGIPLAMLKKPFGKHEVILNFTGVQWTIYVDGELLDNDFPFGYPPWADENTWRCNAEFVKSAAVYFPAIVPQKKRTNARNAASGIQYWLPPHHNDWVGDVATIYHQGRYHIFYLYDRRHHCSKFCGGSHYFEHLSTADFKTWTEHEAATPLETQWECIGTGTPFVSNGKLCISYGLHTTRVHPQEKTMLPAQWEYLKQNGRTGVFPFDLAKGFPAGATYAVSQDGVANFTKSNVLFHPCENPSVYAGPSGKLRMMANYHSNGIWESDSIDGGWRCISPGFPPGGDCTFFFRWGTFDYIIGGFTGLWSKATDAPNSAYDDLAKKGLDFYDGSNVPAITEIPGGRFLSAAWIPIRGWGGNLLLRELVQLPDGRIGSKWMQEITPQTAKPQTLATAIANRTTFAVDEKSFLLAFDVQPKAVKGGKLAVSFLPENGEKESCELQIDLKDQRAQFGPGAADRFADRQKSLREGNSPQHVGNYAIENLLGVDKPFTVRVIVKGNEKIGGTLIDAEIAGKRTMITYRAELTVKKIVFRAAGLDVKNVTTAFLND
jgi:hypothetical protein